MVLAILAMSPTVLLAHLPTHSPVVLAHPRIHLTPTTHAHTRVYAHNTARTVHSTSTARPACQAMQ